MSDDLLAQIDALHDDDPERALELLRTIDVSQLPADRLPRLSFLLDHVFGEKFDLWAEALAGQRVLVARGAANATIFRNAAIAARLAGHPDEERAWTLELASSADAPLAKAQALVALGALQFSVRRLPSEAAGRLTLHALEPLAALPSGGLDAAFAAITNNLASDLLERPLADLGQSDLRAALISCAEHALRFWERAGTWVNRERALALLAMAANALGDGASGAGHARAGLAILDELDRAGDEIVDRAFLELELATGQKLAGLDGDADALARAQAIVTRLGRPRLDRFFAARRARSEALVAHYRS